MAEAVSRLLSAVTRTLHRSVPVVVSVVTARVPLDDAVFGVPWSVTVHVSPPAPAVTSTADQSNSPHVFCRVVVRSPDVTQKLTVPPLSVSFPSVTTKIVVAVLSVRALAESSM